MADWRARRDAWLSNLVREQGPFSKQSLSLAGAWPPEREEAQDSPEKLFWGAIVALSSFKGVKVETCLPRRRSTTWFRLRLKVGAFSLQADLVTSREEQERRQPNQRTPVVWANLESPASPRSLAEDLFRQLVHSLGASRVEEILEEVNV